MTSSFAKPNSAPQGDFLGKLVEAVPYKILTVLTDNGIQFRTLGAAGSAISLITEALACGEPEQAKISAASTPGPTSRPLRPR